MSDKNNDKHRSEDQKSLNRKRAEQKRQDNEAKQRDEQSRMKVEREKRAAEIAGDKENKRLQQNINKHKAELAAREKAAQDFENEQRALNKLNKVNARGIRSSGGGNGRASFMATYSMAKSGFIFSRLTHKNNNKRLNGIQTKMGLSKMKLEQRNNFASVTGNSLTKTQARAAQEHNYRKEKERLSEYTHENTIEGLTQMNYEKQFASIDELSRKRKSQLEMKLTPYNNTKKIIEKLKKKKTKAYKNNRHTEYKKVSAELDFYFQELKRLKQEYKQYIYAQEQKNENVGFEQILVLSEYQYVKLEEQYGAFEAREIFASRVEQMMEKMKDRFGFEPAGFALHLDEGHIDLETGLFTRNIHAQALYYSYDFKNDKNVMRKIRDEAKANPDIPDGKWLRLLGETQNDLWGETMHDLGFQRGFQKKYSQVKRVNEEELQRRSFEKIKSELENEKTDLKLSKKDADLYRQKAEQEFAKREKELREKLAEFKNEVDKFEIEKTENVNSINTDRMKLKSKINEFKAIKNNLNEKEKELYVKRKKLLAVKDKISEKQKEVLKKEKELLQRDKQLADQELELLQMKDLIQEPKRAIGIQSVILETLEFYEETIKKKNIEEIRYVSKKLLKVLSDNFDAYYNQELKIDRDMFNNISKAIENNIRRVSQVEREIIKELKYSPDFDASVDFNKTPKKVFKDKVGKSIDND